MEPYERLHRYARYLITKFENKYHLRLDVRHIKFSRWGGSVYENLRGETVLEVPFTDDRATFREFLYHELGHVILDNGHIDRRRIRIFRSRGCRNIFSYWLWVLIANFLPPKRGFITPYALVDDAEDFCEVFAFVACGAQNFSGQKVCLSEDKVLSQKVESVKRVFLELEKTGLYSSN